jgi:hypothetical protein
VAGDETASHDYDWLMLELYDQTVREQSGGDMLAYLRQNPIPNESFVYAQIGEEGRELVRALRQQNSSTLLHRAAAAESIPHRLVTKLHALPALAKRRLLWWVLGADGVRALEVGRFRLGGEPHHWMYDRYSLARLLQETGFGDPAVCGPSSSQIPGWSDFHLDTHPDGTVIKPDLFFMEATRRQVKSRG